MHGIIELQLAWIQCKCALHLAPTPIVWIRARLCCCVFCMADAVAPSERAVAGPVELASHSVCLLKSFLNHARRR